MSNLSELLPSGGGQNAVDFVASGTLPNGRAVVLKSNGQVEIVSATALSVGSNDSNGASQKLTYYGGCCYHSANNTIIISYNNSANNQYPTAAVCTVSGSTITIGTPTVLSSSMSGLMTKCAYDVTQNKVVFFYAPQGTGYVKAATVNGNSFSFGSQVAVFGSYSLGNRAGDISNLDNSKVAICWGNAASGHAGVQAISISGTSLTMGTVKQITGWDSYGMRMASGKKGELLIQMGGTSQLGYVAGTVSGTTITLGSVSQFSGSSYINHVASGFWAGYTSPESTYIAVHQHPGGAEGDSRARVITVSGTTLTLNSEISLTADPTGDISVGWANSANTGILYYRSNTNNGSGYATELSYSGSTLTEGQTATLGVGRYGYPVATFDPSSGKSIVLYQASVNSDEATVSLVTPSSTNLTSTNLLGISAGAISSGATGTINLFGGINESQSSLAIGSDYYVQTNGTITTASASPAQRIGTAISATQINIKDLT